MIQLKIMISEKIEFSMFDPFGDVSGMKNHQKSDFLEGPQNIYIYIYIWGGVLPPMQSRVYNLDFWEG